MKTLRQLVVGTDFSKGAARALELALGIADATAARVTLVHVCDLGADGGDDERLQRCDEALARLVAQHRGPRVEVEGVLRSGKAWMKLDNVAVEVGASLILVGRIGAGSRGVELGSVADRLVHFASRPVLTVPREFRTPRW